MNQRRKFLSTGTGLALAGFATPSMPAMAADDNTAMSREDYDHYVQLFNDNDFRFLEYYHPDVVLELGDSEIRTAQGIGEFYKTVKAHLKETVEVNQFIADANGIAVEIPTRFECFKDWDDSFWGRPIKAGEVLRIISFGMYVVEDSKFKHIKSARYKIINDWQMEG